MSILFYKRPDYVKRPPGPLDASSCQRIVAKTHAHKSSIPSSIAFDQIIKEQSLPPCSLSDFMDYLVYISHDAENLQFFLWYRNYTHRFGLLNEVETMRSPEWDPSQAQSHLDTVDFTHFGTQPTSVVGDAPSAVEAHRHRSQPFREEIEKMTAHYLLTGSPRELNISHRNRIDALRALKYTTHPSALAPVASLIETVLREQLHPNFIRWTICNGNMPKVILARGVGTLFNLIGVTMTVLLCVSHASRWWRIFCFVPYMVGITILTASYKGLCIALHVNGNKRSIRPWEDFSTTSNKASCAYLDANLESRLSTTQSTKGLVRPPSSSVKSTSVSEEKMESPKSKWLDVFGSKNQFDDESWIEKWRNRPLLRRIMEPTTWVQEEGVRIMQTKILKQSQLWGLLGASCCTVVIVALPKGNQF